MRTFMKHRVITALQITLWAHVILHILGMHCTAIAILINPWFIEDVGKCFKRR